MNQTAHDINARGQRAVEAHARAETDAVFDAAAALLDAAPERARPSSWRAEMDTAPPTTSKLTISVEAAAIVDCSCPRAAACIAAARAAAARSSRLTAPSTASSDAGHRLSGGATSQHLARPCHQSLVFAIISPARFFCPPKRRSTELFVQLCDEDDRCRMWHVHVDVPHLGQTL